MRNQGEHEVAEVQDCQSEISMQLFLHLSLVPAVLIVLVLSYLQKRDHRLAIDRRLPFLGGRFGIVVPLDSIGSLSNRWSYGFAFGAVSSSVLLLFSESYILFPVPSWARAIVYLIGALEVGLVFFPFFACLSTPFRTTGAVLGILYSLSWIMVTVWDTFTCPDGKILGKYQKLIVQWPCILSLNFLLGRFIYILVKACRIHLQLEQEDPSELIEQHQVQHVKRLLRRTPAHSKCRSWLRSKVYEWDPYFKFPNRIIGTAIISLIGLYTMTLADYRLSNVAFDEIERWKNTLKQLVTSSNNTEALGALIPQLEEFIVVARGSWLATTIFASLNSVAYCFHVLACYRKHLKRLWKGQKGFLPEKFHNPRSAVSVVSFHRKILWLADSVYIVGKAFHCFNYFFFFYNVVMGISNCILRLLCSVVVGTWLVSRIDRSIMQRGYETMDAGYTTWIGMIFADHYHSNPVMVCFCQLLVSNSLEKHTASVYSTFSNGPSESPVNSRARRRWMLFYTLLRNPILILLRKHHLSSSSTLPTSSSSSSPYPYTVVQARVMALKTQNTRAEARPPPGILITPAKDS
ncbi:STRA6-like isoform 4-T5 [Spinachia spinachia]